MQTLSVCTSLKYFRFFRAWYWKFTKWNDNLGPVSRKIKPYPLPAFKREFLTLFQTINFRLFQTERICRWQFQMWWKWQKGLQISRKHWEKDKLLVTINFSFSHSVFKRLILQTRINQGLFRKGLINAPRTTFLLHRIYPAIFQSRRAWHAQTTIIRGSSLNFRFQRHSKQVIANIFLLVF